MMKHVIQRCILNDILTQFGVPKELVRIIKMCLDETYSKGCIGFHMHSLLKMVSNMGKFYRICF